MGPTMWGRSRYALYEGLLGFAARIDGWGLRGFLLAAAGAEDCDAADRAKRDHCKL
jgi:hypothetical protein